MTAIAPAASDTLDRWGRAAVTTVGVGAVFVIGRSYLPFTLSCPLLSTTGVPCPFCGITRLADALRHGHVHHAVTTDPGGTLLLAVLVALPVLALVLRAGPSTDDTFAGSSPGPTLRQRVVQITPLVAVLALGVHWFTVAWFGADVITR